MRILGTVLLSVGASATTSVPMWYHSELLRTKELHYKDPQILDALNRASQGRVDTHVISPEWVTWWRAMCIDFSVRNPDLRACIPDGRRGMVLVSSFPGPITVQFPAVAAVRSYRGAELFLIVHGWTEISTRDLKASAGISDIHSDAAGRYHDQFQQLTKVPMWFHLAVTAHADWSYILDRAAEIDGGLEWIASIPRPIFKLLLNAWKWAIDNRTNYDRRSLLRSKNDMVMMPSLSKPLFENMFGRESATRMVIRSMVDALLEYPLLSWSQLVQCLLLAGGLDPEFAQFVVDKYFPVIKSLSRMSIWAHGTLMASNNDLPMSVLAPLMQPVENDIFTTVERLELWNRLCVDPLKNPEGSEVPCAANFKHEVQLSILSEQKLYWNLKWILLSKSYI